MGQFVTAYPPLFSIAELAMVTPLSTFCKSMAFPEKSEMSVFSTVIPAEVWMPENPAWPPQSTWQ